MAEGDRSLEARLRTEEVPVSDRYDDFDRALLRAGRRDRAPSRLRRNALAAAGASATTLVASKALGSAAGSTLGSGAVVGKTVLPLTLLKWTLAISVGVGTASAGVYAVGKRADTKKTSVTAPSTAVALPKAVPAAQPTQGPVESPPSLVTPAPDPTVVVQPRSEMPIVRATPASRERVPATEPSAPASSVAELPSPTPPAAAEPARTNRSLLADEIGLVDAARRALARGDVASTLRLVDEHESRHPSGAFAVERDALRVDALVASGRQAEARDAARSFLNRHRNTAQAQRISKIAAEGTFP